MRYKDYSNRRQKASDFDREQIILPKDEYAMVMSELNTHMSDEDRSRRIVTKPIGSYYYTVINNGFDDYIVIGKRAISAEADVIWEESDDE